jgi:hypothetical protein
MSAFAKTSSTFFDVTNSITYECINPPVAPKLSCPDASPTDHQM